MPNYEYVCHNVDCPQSDRILELFKPITDKTPVTCYGCGAEMKKLISRTEFRMHSIKEK